MFTTLIAAAIAAAAPTAVPSQPADAHAKHEQQPGQHEGMECCKHMKGDTKDCCKDMAAAEKAKCCADRAAEHADHHKQ